jgi:RNA polymerase sigma-54 factor
MAFEIKQSLKLGQQLVMTPQLQQAIKLLQLSRQELVDVVTQELMENPILEESGEGADGEASSTTPDGSDIEIKAGEFEQQTRDETAMNESQVVGDEQKLLQGKDDFNWDAYIEDFNSNLPSSSSMKEVNEDLPSFEGALTKTESLEEHILWQLSMMAISSEERRLGELILGNLNEDGYLQASLEDLAKEVGIELEDAEEFLKVIQNLDPIGVGSRDLRECLLAQAMLMNPRQEIVEQIIDKHLGDLERKNYQNIVKSIGVPLEKIVECTRLLMEFEPKPGRSFNTGDTHYVQPDIYIYKVGDEFMIVLNEDGMPKLRISPYYKNILASAKKDTAAGNGNGTKDYVQDKLRSAVWLIRSIHNRQKTIYKVTEAIVRRQRDFFEKGVQHLKPMILKDVANDIGMHESTISRVTTNKYAHTPVGIFELKYFFNSSINSADGGDSLASEAVKEKIKQMVSKEDPKNPLSDQKIVELLRNDNIDIARRTVAKYRDMLHILSSAKRKQIL